MSDEPRNAGGNDRDEDLADPPRDALAELRHVTGPPGPTPAWRSDESAGLRQTWLAFGELLDAAAPEDVDRVALVEAVRARQRRAGPRTSWGSMRSHCAASR